MKAHKMLLIAVLLVGVSGAFSTALAVRDSSQESERSRKRDEWQRPAEVFDALGVKPGHRVADIGCGFGYFTFRLAARVGAEGKIYAVDIDKEAIDKVRERKEREKLGQIEPILGQSKMLAAIFFNYEIEIMLREIERLVAKSANRLAPQP